jgi:hypothetical protein
VARRCCPACWSTAVLPHSRSDAPQVADKKNSRGFLSRPAAGLQDVAPPPRQHDTVLCDTAAQSLVPNRCSIGPHRKQHWFFWGFLCWLVLRRRSETASAKQYHGTLCGKVAPCPFANNFVNPSTAPPFFFFSGFVSCSSMLRNERMKPLDVTICCEPWL